MNWSDEKYVKLYTRRTATQLSWPWQARCVFPLLLTVADGAGLVETGRLDAAQAVALLIMVPAEVVAQALAALLADGTVEAVQGGLLISHFLEAQEARKTDARKKQDSRERQRAKAREITAPRVTECHPVSPVGTLQPSPAQPSPAQISSTTAEETPSRARASEPPGGPPPPPKLPVDPLASPEAFFAWAQHERASAGLVTEKPPHPRKLSAWWSEVLLELGGDAERLRVALGAFARDGYWRAKQPPCPFPAFMSEWRKYAPAAVARRAT